MIQQSSSSIVNDLYVESISCVTVASVVIFVVRVSDVVPTSNGDVGTIVVLLISLDIVIVVTMDMELGLDMGLVILVLCIFFSVIP